MSADSNVQGLSQGMWFDWDEFAAMTGFQAGLDGLAERGEAKWTNTATDLHTGGVHGLRYKVKKNEDGAPDVMLQHWVRWPGDRTPPDELRKRNRDILTMKTETTIRPDGRVLVRPVAVTWMGRKYETPADLMKFMQILQETSSRIRDNIARNSERALPFDADVFSGLQRRVRQTKRRDEIPNLYEIARTADIKAPFSLEGMYYNGEFNFGEPSASAGGQAPAFPLQMLGPLLGIEADIVRHNAKSFSRPYTVAAGGGMMSVAYHFSPGEDGTQFEISCKVTEIAQNGTRKETLLYSAHFARENPAQDDLLGQKTYRLQSMEMLGNKPDITDDKGVARALRAMKYIHLAIQRDEAPMISDIIHEHDLKSFLRKPEAPQSGPDNPRTLIQVFGANMDAVLTRRELGIGSNGMLVIRDFTTQGEWVRQGIGIDWGVTFGDPKKDHYHTITQNYGRFLRHPGSPHIKPYVDTFLNLETHEHEDHLRGVARLAKFGFNLPPMIMNEHTRRVLKRMMSEENVDGARIDTIMARCHVIDVREFAKKEAGVSEKFTYGDTVLEQGVEEIWSESEKRFKRFPIITAYTKQHPDARTQIRVGPSGHSAHGLMFQVDGVLYTGDYKLDQTLPEDVRTDLDWLKRAGERAAVHIQESTNAMKDIEFNPTVAEVKENRKKILAAEQGRRVLYDTIGSNAVDIEMFCRAAGEVRLASYGLDDDARKAVTDKDGPYKYVIFAGSAVRNKYGDLNQTHSFKKMMREQYGIKTLHVGSKQAKALLKGADKSSYIVVMTGTQDEPLSISHRVSRDLHPDIRLAAGDVVIRGQVPIPVPGNAARRQEQNNRYRHDFGCKVYDAQELAEEGVYIYTSSHASREDYKKIHETTGDLLKIVHHGGPEQIKKMKTILSSFGARSIVPDKQAVYEVDKANKDVRVVSETPEERVGYREIRDDADEFYKKHRQQPTVIPVKDRWQGAPGSAVDAMYRFEHAVDAREARRNAHNPTSRGANLAEQFNDSASDDFPLIGVLHPQIQRPYYEHHKNIKLFITGDSETTGANPSSDVPTDASFVASTPDNQVVAEKTLRLKLPRYRLVSPGALLVTGNFTPKKLYEKGMALRQYAYGLFKIYRDWVKELTDDPKARAVFAGYRNGVFDDPISMRVFGTALASNDMKPMATHGNLQLDVYNLYTAMIALAPDKVSAKTDAKGNFIRTLEQACLSNGIEYETRDHEKISGGPQDNKAHGSLYDAHRTRLLLFKLKEAAPDIFEQMLMNCDFSASRSSPMVDHILGQDLHLNDQAPVFGYVDMRDRKCQPRLGALVTIDTTVSKATDAIVLDLAKADIHHLEQLPDHKLLEIMDDPDGPFAVIKMNNSPCWFPPQMIWNDPKLRGKAIGRLPKQTVMQRASALKQLRGNEQDVGNNFIQRVQRLYARSHLCRANAPAAQQAKRGASISRSFKLPGDRIFSLYHVMKSVNRIKNRHYQEAAKLLRELQPNDSEFERDFDREKFWKGKLKAVQKLSHDTGGRDPYIEDIRFLVEWLVDDINPKYLAKADHARINALKSAMLHGPANAHTMTVERFERELNEIENDPAQFAKMVGDDPEAKERWKQIKADYMEYAQALSRTTYFRMTENKREQMREFRRNQGQSGPRP